MRGINCYASGHKATNYQKESISPRGLPPQNCLFRRLKVFPDPHLDVTSCCDSFAPAHSRPGALLHVPTR